MVKTIVQILIAMFMDSFDGKLFNIYLIIDRLISILLSGISFLWIVNQLCSADQTNISVKKSENQICYLIRKLWQYRQCQSNFLVVSFDLVFGENFAMIEAARCHKK